MKRRLFFFPLKYEHSLFQLYKIFSIDKVTTYEILLLFLVMKLTHKNNLKLLSKSTATDILIKRKRFGYSTNLYYSQAKSRYAVK